MQTLSFQAEVGPDRKLRVELPIDVPPGPVEGVVVVQGVTRHNTPPYKSLAGILKGVLPADVDIDADLKEIRSAWTKRLEIEP